MKESFFAKRTLKNNRGFSLAEIMVSSAIAGIVAIGASSTYLFIIDNFRIMVDQNAAQENLMWGAFLTKSWLQQADEFYTPDSACNAGTDHERSDGNAIVASGTGQNIAGYTYAMVDGPVGTDMSCHSIVFDFLRQDSVGGGGLSMPSQISFSRQEFVTDLSAPQGDFLTRQVLGKVLFFRNQGRKTVADGVAVPTFPTYGDSVWFDRFSDYRVTDTIEVNGSLSSIYIKMSTRYWVTLKNKILPHCADMSDAGCDGIADKNGNFKDLSQSLIVGMRNYDFDDDDGGLHGNIYYYRFMAPPVLTGMDYE